jgi:uncharacterized surface protein with fasciclin (FAS1) repeats
MSQAKVDRYKEEKRNRKEIIKKEKRQWMLTKCGMSLVALVLVAWVGYSVYTGFSASDTTETELPSYTIDTTVLDDYISGLDSVY